MRRRSRNRADHSESYKLTDIPPGDYKLEAWHATPGRPTKKVAVKAKTGTKADFEFAGK